MEIELAVKIDSAVEIEPAVKKGKSLISTVESILKRLKGDKKRGGNAYFFPLLS